MVDYTLQCETGHVGMEGVGLGEAPKLLADDVEVRFVNMSPGALIPLREGDFEKLRNFKLVFRPK